LKTFNFESKTLHQISTNISNLYRKLTAHHQSRSNEHKHGKSVRGNLRTIQEQIQKAQGIIKHLKLHEDHAKDCQQLRKENTLKQHKFSN
jgi:hypothetical protein